MKTLLERREEKLKEKMELLYDLFDNAKACYDRKKSDLTYRLDDLQKIVTEAHKLSLVIDDIKALEKYGPRGGY